MLRFAWSLVAVCALGASAPARAAEAWLLSVEAPAAVPLSQPQRSLFGPGALPAAAAYRSFTPQVLGGLRLRAGAFANGSAPSDHTLRDPGVGGLGSVTLAVRVRPLAPSGDASRTRGLWVEVAGGGGLTGTLLRATAEAGLGWNFRAGKLTLGPALRYLQVVQPADPLESRDARMALVGLEAGFFDPRPAPPVVVVAPPPPPPPRDSDGDGLVDEEDKCPRDPEDADGFEDADGCPDPDNDHDGVLDAEDKCPAEAEVVNGVDDTDGCPDEGLIELKGDRIVLDERVLFDTARARVKTAARAHLIAIVTLWKQHPEWTRMSIEGHADVRGPDKFNDWLSGERAQRVRAVLVELGIPADKVETKGYGRSKPREAGSSPEAHQQNRRVEFVIESGPASSPAPRGGGREGVVAPGKSSSSSSSSPTTTTTTTTATTPRNETAVPATKSPSPSPTAPPPATEPPPAPKPVEPPPAPKPVEPPPMAPVAPPPFAPGGAP